MRPNYGTNFYGLVKIERSEFGLPVSSNYEFDIYFLISE